jgi:hypothetical protein
MDHAAFILAKLAKRGSYHGIDKGKEWRVAKALAEADPTITYAETVHGPEGGQPVKGPGGKLLGWGGTLKGYTSWSLTKPKETSHA